MEIGEHGRLPLPPFNGSEHSDDSEHGDECAVVTLDRTANVISWNDEAEQLFGYSARMAIGKPIYHFLDLDSLTPGSVEWELLTAYYRGSSTCNRQYARSDGTRFRATTEVSPLWDGAFLGYRLTFSSVKHTHTQIVPMNGLSSDYSTVV
jgi:PAS domain S-box-containing protein